MIHTEEECTLLWAGECSCRYCADFPVELSHAASMVVPITGRRQVRPHDVGAVDPLAA